MLLCLFLTHQRGTSILKVFSLMLKTLTTEQQTNKKHIFNFNIFMQFNYSLLLDQVKPDKCTFEWGANLVKIANDCF